MLISYGFSFESYGYSSTNNNGINWGEICQNPLVDALISEPCNILTTNNGYTLTPEGERVLGCIAGGGILLFIDPTGATLAAAQALGSATGCGNSNSNGINAENLLSGLFGK